MLESSLIGSPDAIRFSAAESVNNISLLAQLACLCYNVNVRMRKTECSDLANMEEVEVPYNPRKLQLARIRGTQKLPIAISQPCCASRQCLKDIGWHPNEGISAIATLSIQLETLLRRDQWGLVRASHADSQPLSAPAGRTAAVARFRLAPAPELGFEQTPTSGSALHCVTGWESGAYAKQHGEVIPRQMGHAYVRLEALD